MDKNGSATIDQHISTFPDNVQAMLRQLRETIQKAAPAATEAISYGIPTFKLNGNLVHFAGYKNHIGFYPGAAGIASFEAELAAYKFSKGAVQFPLDKPLPLKLVTKIVKFRVQQQELKKAPAKKVKKP